MHKMLHPKADVERLYIPRKDGGRGLIDSISKNATKFKREVTMPEIENREDKSASENAKALKHVFKCQDEVNERRKVDKQSIAWPASKDPSEASCRHSHHQQMVVK